MVWYPRRSHYYIPVGADADIEQGDIFWGVPSLSAVHPSVADQFRPPGRLPQAEELPPPALSAAQVQRLLDNVPRDRVRGARDFAIMMLIARLGLRSVEVARLELRHVDWRAGELVVCGKGRRQDRLPLPEEVGEALVAYLSLRRNPHGDPHLFLMCRAPRGPIRADLVGDVMKRACLHAGVTHVGPHRLRHALAGELLRRGAGLVAISQVLRHQDLATTAVYAKVDLVALRRVAHPWPGATR